MCDGFTIRERRRSLVVWWATARVASTFRSEDMQRQRSGEFWWLVSQVKPFVRLHSGSYLCVIAASVLVLLDPLIVRFLIDEVIPNRRATWLPLVAAAFFFTYMGRLGFDSLAGILNFRAVQKMTYRTRLALLRHLQRLSAEYHDNTSPGDT